MDYELITVEKKDHLTIVTINRPGQFSTGRRADAIHHFRTINCNDR